MAEGENFRGYAVSKLALGKFCAKIYGGVTQARDPQTQAIVLNGLIDSSLSKTSLTDLLEKHGDKFRKEILPNLRLNVGDKWYFVYNISSKTLLTIYQKEAFLEVKDEYGSFDEKNVVKD